MTCVEVRVKMTVTLIVTQGSGGGVTVMRLSEMQVRMAKPTARQWRLSDGDGLYLLVTPKGQKWWRFDHRFEGTRKTLSMGVYPDVSLVDARSLRVISTARFYSRTPSRRSPENG